VSLPGADELFRTTGGTALTSPRSHDPARAGSGSDADGSGGASGVNGVNGSAVGKQPGSGAEGGSTAAAGAAGGPASEEHGSAARGENERAGGRRAPAPGGVAGAAAAGIPAQDGPARRNSRSPRRPSGRERHDEKITVYVSAEELMDLEHARLVLRGENGLAVDRGRIVREAVAVVLADLEQRGEASILVRRLRGR
jgi:hypothetical protein